MKLTPEQLAAFVGGDMEIQNRGEDYLFRGPLKSVTVEGTEFKAEFEWVAKNDGGPNHPSEAWTSNDRLDYAASLEIYSASNIGDGRLCLQSPIVGEVVVLFPPSGSKLDRARVRGLQAV